MRYVIVSKKQRGENKSPLYWNLASRAWGPYLQASVFTTKEKNTYIKSSFFPEDGEWELFSEGDQLLQVRCPKCGYGVFEDVHVNVTVSFDFRAVTYNGEEDHAEMEFDGNEENHGGVHDRIQCKKCAHVVARSYPEFRTWIKANLAKGTPVQSPE